MATLIRAVPVLDDKGKSRKFSWQQAFEAAKLDGLATPKKWADFIFGLSTSPSLEMNRYGSFWTNVWVVSTSFSRRNRDDPIDETHEDSDRVARTYRLSGSDTTQFDPQNTRKTISVFAVQPRRLVPRDSCIYLDPAHIEMITLPRLESHLRSFEVAVGVSGDIDAHGFPYEFEAKKRKRGGQGDACAQIIYPNTGTFVRPIIVMPGAVGGTSSSGHSGSENIRYRISAVSPSMQASIAHFESYDSDSRVVRLHQIPDGIHDAVEGTFLKGVSREELARLVTLVEGNPLQLRKLLNILQ